MDFTQFRKEIHKTESQIKTIPSNKFRLLQGVIGLSTEAGELLDAVKKHVFQHRNLDKTNMKEELGDLMHYFAIIMNELNLQQKDVLAANIKKLQFRYKKGFSSTASKNRNVEKERNILEER